MKQDINLFFKYGEFQRKYKLISKYKDFGNTFINLLKI